MPDDHGAFEAAMGLWTDADFHAIAEAQARAAADAAAQQDLDHLQGRRRYFAEKRLIEDNRQRVRQQREDERKRKIALKGMQEIARLSAAHQLNGYDRNVLAQWEASGFNGKRPQLSFELQDAWRSEEERERAQVERDRQEHLAKLERLEEQRREAERQRLERERKRQEHEEWRRANPELAAQQDAKEAAERERRRQEREAQAAIKEMETALQERKDQIRAFVYHHGPQELNAEDFLFWAETLAAPEELEAFDQDCLRRARPPGANAAFQQSFGFNFWPFHSSPDSTSDS